METTATTTTTSVCNYGVDVLGEQLALKLLKSGDGGERWFMGEVTEVRIKKHPTRQGELITNHILTFDDGTTMEVNLWHMEKSGFLRWMNFAAKGVATKSFSKNTKKKRRIVSVCRHPASEEAPPMMSVEKDNNAGRAALSKKPKEDNANDAAVRKKKPGRPTSKKPRAAEFDNDDWPPGMEDYMRDVEDWKYNSIGVLMAKVKQLINGKGVGNVHFPEGVRFYAGIKVGMSSDFEKLQKDALEFETKYPPPNGRKILSCPVGKMEAFKNWYLANNKQPQQAPQQPPPPPQPQQPQDTDNINKNDDNSSKDDDDNNSNKDDNSQTTTTTGCI